MAIIERDTAQYRKERLDKLILERQSKTNLFAEKQAETKQTQAATETTFNTLQYDAQEGAKLGDYEVAYKARNRTDQWQSAYNILNVNNATIQNRYHGEGYLFSYWLYGTDKIYRQKLKEQKG